MERFKRELASETREFPVSGESSARQLGIASSSDSLTRIP